MDRFWRAITAVAMEGTGIYWKPIFNILEDDFDVVLANAEALKNVPGRKTDVKDCQWIAHLFRNGLISGSFIPPREIRELRDLTRTRRKLVGAMTSEKNRVQKVLEDANIKISSVVSKVFGVSSLAMICALLEKDELFADEIAKMSRDKLKKKVDQLVEALNGNVAAAIPLLDTYRAMLRIPDCEPPSRPPDPRCVASTDGGCVLCLPPRLSAHDACCDQVRSTERLRDVAVGR